MKLNLKVSKRSDRTGSAIRFNMLASAHGPGPEGSGLGQVLMGRSSKYMIYLDFFHG